MKLPEINPSVAILLSGILIAAAVVFVRSSPSAAEANDTLPGNVSVPAPSAEDHRYGSPDAEVVLVEYMDFECVYCSMVQSTFKRLVDESNGKVAWVMRHLPLDSIHREARGAGLAAECIAEQLGSEGWFRFADAVFVNQDTLGNARYLELGREFGADVSLYLSCISSQKHSQKLDDQAAEATIAGAQETPFTVVYGKGLQVPMPGALPYAQFSAVIKAVEARQ